MAPFIQTHFSGIDQTSPSGDERALEATDLLCDTCRAKGLKVSSWHEFEAWNAYVAGRIDESQLSDMARRELEHYLASHGKHLIIDKENPLAAQKEFEWKRRSKRAGRVYRDVCRNAGLTLCFFNSFTTWTEYVRESSARKSSGRWPAAKSMRGSQPRP